MMPDKSLLVALTLGLIPLLAPSLALAQACGKNPVAISCPAGQEWDGAVMLCLPLSA